MAFLYINSIPFILSKTQISNSISNKTMSMCIKMFHDKSLIYLADLVDKTKAYDTKYSQAVTHPSTNFARQGLTSVIGREPVLSLWYGRRHSFFLIIIHSFFKSNISISPISFLKNGKLKQKLNNGVSLFELNCLYTFNNTDIELNIKQNYNHVHKNVS